MVNVNIIKAIILEGERKYFSCSAYRDKKGCDFRKELSGKLIIYIWYFV